MQQRCVVIGRRSPGELAAVVLVLVALLAAVVAAPAAAAVPAAARSPQVTASDALVVWDGTRETFALRWHLSAPATRVDWLVAVPAGARTAQVPRDAIGVLADVAAPRDRWIVTHPWLLVGDEGDRARDHLVSALAAAPAGVRATTTPGEADGTDGTDDGADAALRAAAAAGVPVDAGTRQWAAAATLRGWQVRLVTVTVPEPSTVVGPVALDLPVTSPLVPATAWPAGGDLTLVTVADRVLAPDQPDVALAGRSVPPLTVENARTLRGTTPVLAGRAVPAGGWVVTALAGQQPAEGTALVAQGGAIRDWRTQVGVWWPGWGTAALTGLTVVAAVALGVVLSRRRARPAAQPPAPAVPVPAAQTATEETVEADTLTDLTTVAEDPLVDTRPDLGPVRAGLSSPSHPPRP